MANPQNFLGLKVQGSGGSTKTVRGFASANDAGGRFVQAQEIELRVISSTRMRMFAASVQVRLQQPGLCKVVL